MEESTARDDSVLFTKNKSSIISCKEDANNKTVKQESEEQKNEIP